jgi:hypothetical protein
MLRIATVQVSAVANSGKNGLAFKDWLGESRRVKVPLPRKTFSVPIFDDKRLPHSAVRAADARLRLRNLDAPNMPATVAYRFILFHRISVSALY